MVSPMNNKRPILLLGGHGMLAAALSRSLKRRGLTAESVDRDICDITDQQQVDSLFERLQPGLVLNAAAYTAVDQAEQEEELATAINGTAAGHLADACKRSGATLVHFSTDFVFDGKSETPYATDAQPNPISAYGRSKLAGERAIRESGLDDCLIVRTAWLYGPWAGRPFPKVILDAARDGKPLKVVADQQGAPTFTVDLADATLDLVEKQAHGVYHVTGGGRTTWFDFTKKILDVFGVTPQSLEPTTADDWARQRPESARRPAFSVLDCSKAEATLGRPMRPWDAALLDYRTLTAGQP